MNREIKFRGKSVYADVWVYGYIQFSKDKSSAWICESKEDDWTVKKQFPVIPETVGQYTGLKDKNGKEIYEGDILGVNTSIEYEYVVEWNENNCCFTSIQGGIDNLIGDIDSEINFHLLSNMRLDLCDVIGNIYDNPELLEEEHEN